MVLWAAAGLAGCAAWPSGSFGTGSHHAALRGAAPTDPITRSCAAWFDAIDAAVEGEQKRDAGDTRIDGFAYLRVNRFLAALGQTLQDEAPGPSPAVHASRVVAWARHLAATDALARSAELQNLSAAGATVLKAKAAGMPRSDSIGTGDVAITTALCREHLLAVDLASADTRRLLLRSARVPDDYSTWQRGAGFYAVTRLPFFAGVQRWQDGAQAQLAQPRDVLFAGVRPTLSFEPMATASARSSATAQPITPNTAPAKAPDPWVRDALGIPALTPAQAQALLWQHAPVFTLAPTGHFDEPGALRWAAPHDTTPQVDPNQPVVYQRISHTLWGGRVRLQLVYTVWFNERPLDSAWDLLGGKLDGVTWRVTLDDALEPLMHDTMHPCGCYHMFFPMQGVVAKPPPEAAEEWAFSPLPPLAPPTPPPTPPSRLVVQLSSRTHDVVGVQYQHADLSPASSTMTAVTRYRLVDDDTLRSLPQSDGTRRSVFDTHGIIPGTGRAERYVFWPMGIANPGAMRQWGRHATAFVGRRHFDDADLLDLRFTAPVGR